MKRKHLIASLPLAGLFVIGCATSPAPVERVASAQAAIRSAEEVGARHVPEAKLHLQLALEQTEHGKQLAKDGDNERAASVLMRAEADAELALALARESTLRGEAQEALEKVRALRSQARPGSGP